MRILILGANGLIGHQLFYRLSNHFDVFGTVRNYKNELVNSINVNPNRIVNNLDVLNYSELEGVLKAINPDVLINCIGITKRRDEINNRICAFSTNALFPHKVAQLCLEYNIRTINFSTDCVFHGESGNYDENSTTNALDIYGRTKAFGEVTDMKNSLTIRSSFIGRELMYKSELLEWFISQKGNVIKGYTKAMYSGVSTVFMCNLISDIIQNHKDLSGLYQLAPDNPISKYNLLLIAKKAFNINIDIIPDESLVSDKSLKNDKLKNAINLEIPSWEEMMEELAKSNIYK